MFELALFSYYYPNFILFVGEGHFRFFRDTG